MIVLVVIYSLLNKPHILCGHYFARETSPFKFQVGQASALTFTRTSLSSAATVVTLIVLMHQQQQCVQFTT